MIYFYKTKEQIEQETKEILDKIWDITSEEDDTPKKKKSFQDLVLTKEMNFLSEEK
ncbi:MAG: hypothetical protein ACRDFB_09255 [Rhabdochlamydiaceae bacterium]